MSSPQFTAEQLAPWCEARYDRSAGPGGQNVNKLNTRVTLLFDVDGCSLLSDHQRARARARLATRLAADGRIRVVAQQQRSQAQNRAAAAARLAELLTEALAVRKTRRPSRPTAGSRERRLDAKKRRGAVKRERRGDW
jgi:ribosome-associated protein